MCDSKNPRILMSQFARIGSTNHRTLLRMELFEGDIAFQTSQLRLLKQSVTCFSEAVGFVDPLHLTEIRSKRELEEADSFSYRAHTH